MDGGQTERMGDVFQANLSICIFMSLNCKTIKKEKKNFKKQLLSEKMAQTYVLADKRPLSPIFPSSTDKNSVLAVTSDSHLAFLPLKDAIALKLSYLFRIPQKPETSISVPLELAKWGRFVTLDTGPGFRLAHVPLPMQNPEELEMDDVVYLNYNNRPPGPNESSSGLPPGISISHLRVNPNGIGGTHIILGRGGDGRLGLITDGDTKARGSARGLTFMVPVNYKWAKWLWLLLPIVLVVGIYLHMRIK